MENLLSRGSNDDKQVQALDINHLFLTMCADNKLHFAPLGNNVQVSCPATYRKSFESLRTAVSF